MSISCPNKRLVAWKNLVKNVGENKSYVLWAEYEGNVPDKYYESNIQSNEIFPNSIEKRILYHGSDNPNIKDFNLEFEGTKNLGKGINFTDDIEYAKEYGKYIYEVKLNISKWVDKDSEAKENSTYGINDIDEIVVYHPSQISIINKPNTFENKVVKNVKKSLLDFVNYTEEKVNSLKKDYSSEHSRILFNNKQGKITVDEILDNILNNFNDLSPEGKTLLEKSRRLVGRTGAKFQFVSDAQMKQTNTLMQIEGDTNVIQISRNRIKNIKPKEIVESFIHELVHAQTLQALINPQTYEERDFKEFVTKYYRIFKAKSNFSDSYGFDKVEEFVAEIYANPDFRAELQKLDSVEKTNLWTDLINHIRRLFGLAKSKKVNDLIESVIDYVEADRRDNQGLLSQKSLVFEKRLVTEDTYHSLDDKFNNLNKKALENIEEVLKRTIRANEKKSTDIRVKHITESKELLEEIKKYQTTEKWKAILAYTKSFGVAINFINSKLDDVIQNRNLYEDDLVPVMTGYKDYLASYDLLKDVEGLLNTARLEQDTFTEEEQLEYRNLKSFFENALAEKNKIDGKFEAIYHRQGLKFYSNPMYNTEIETMYRDELRKEYNSLTDSQKDNRSEVEYISEMINTRDKDDFSEDIKAKARNLMTAPSKDIDASSVLLDDSLNIKSKTIQIINNILGETFDIVKTAVLTKVHQMDKQYKEFIKGRGNKPSEINKNLTEKAEDGQHYLRGKYNIKYKESFDKLLEEIKEEQDNSIKKLAVQNVNFEAVKKDKKTISLRPTNQHDYVNGEIVTITVNGLKTGVKVQIDEIHSFNNFKKLSEERKNDFAKAVGNYVDFQDFLNSNDYTKIDSKMSQMYPEIYNFINNNQSMDIISYKKVEDNEKEYESFKNRNKKFKQWYKENTVKDGTKTIPHPKFLNKAISEIEQKQLDSYINIWEENDKIDGFSSLVNRTVGAKFYQLASITKSDLERRIEADVKGLFKDKLNDLTKVMPDDIGIDTEKKNANIVRKTKTHYRGPIESHIQSLDLETMARNEYWNGQNYQSKHVLEHKLNVFAEIVKSKDYYDVKGNTYKGEFSQEYKKILGIIERNVYDIQSHTSDMNKVSSRINGYAASLAMSFNLASGTANLMNGLTQLFIEKFGNDKIKKGTLGKAEMKYTKAVLNGSLLKDTTNTVKQHYFNQLLEKFDVMGGLGQNEQEAIRNSLLSKFGSTKMMNFLNEGGEHMMHCVITEAILDSIKVMNKDNKYIDKDGKVTTKENAASLVDMLYIDSNNQLQMSDKVVFTSQNLKVEYHEGGNVHINMLIKKKVFDLFGVYDAKFKNELSKTWYGKSVMMFKNFFMGGLSNRFTGFKTARRDKSLLEDDDKFYNSAEKEYIEGTYITLTRFFTNEVIPNLKNLSLIWQSYDNLSEYEKANLRKATMEIVISTVVIPSVGLLLASLAGDSDDDEALWFAIYLNARLGQELRQFWNPLDAGKMINNPIAGSRFVNNALSFGYDVISPLNISPKEGESHFDYLKEDKQGNNVMIKHFNQLIPITSQFKEIDGFMGKNYQQLYGLQYGSK